ncbi:hypothetical protein BDN70DRAFT_928022 [Pholiota conissans]|uniref:Uncharacterized protein n=1 Tax=Pholiota conissans TaxID=109636 RepID=A0A9P6D6C3_9AGAR|nr:hypothetical protein BDN70DRAFT_928022 [Pholiota conissans]
MDKQNPSSATATNSYLRTKPSSLILLIKRTSINNLTMPVDFVAKSSAQNIKNPEMDQVDTETQEYGMRIDDENHTPYAYAPPNSYRTNDDSQSQQLSHDASLAASRELQRKSAMLPVSKLICSTFEGGLSSRGTSRPRFNTVFISNEGLLVDGATYRLSIAIVY